MNNKYYYDNDNNKIKIDNSAEFNVEILKKSETLKVDKVMNKTAKLVTVAPKEDDFLYIRNRAVSAGNVIPQPDGSAISVPIDEYYKNFEKYSKICRNANDNGDFFSEEELKIGRDFWNMVCKTDQGYEIVLDEYKKNAHFIIEALNKIKKVYLPNA